MRNIFGRLSRRSVVLGGATSLISGSFAFADNSPQVVPNAAIETEKSKPRPLSIVEQLQHSTVLLRAKNFAGVGSTGTGFLFSFFRNGDESVLGIVTNKHVVAGQKSISVRWTKRTSAGEPDFGNYVEAELEDVSKRIILHPESEVDLAVILVSDILSNFGNESRPIFAISLDQDLIGSEESLKDFQPLEEIIVVGYPDGLSDTRNNTPIFRRGITATPVYMRYEGKKQFMIDAAIYSGSSGSPVFLYNVGAWMGRDGATKLGTRVSLLGVVWGVWSVATEGDIRLVPAPTQYKQVAVSSIPHNLGACVPSYCILDFEPEIVKRGYNPPNNYRMRSQK